MPEREAGSAPQFTLHGSRPNPFHGSTTFSFALGITSDVRARVYDAMGRLVAEPFRGRFAPGPHDIAWNGTGVTGRRLSPGRYLYEIRTGSTVRTGRLVLLR